MDASSSTLTPTGEPVVHRFEFRGKASEYFRIWIVNIALSIVTLGIYSAWAKVRARRYFYGNTFLNGTSFDYHGDPIAILKGRIIFATFFIIYNLGGVYAPLRAIIILAIAAFPWLFVRGMIFNMSNTSYRGVRFGFAKDYKGSYLTYLKLIAYSIFSLGILAGIGIYLHEQFRITRTRYGQTFFAFGGNKWEYWRIYLKAMGILLVLYVFVIGVPILAGVGIFKLNKDDQFQMMLFGGLILIGVYASIGFVATYIRAQTLNFVFRNSSVGGIRFSSKYSTMDLFLIYLGNFFACALTLGLAYPWARIELAKYRANTTAILATPAAFDAFAQAQLEGQTGSVGDQALDFWDIDLGF